MEKNNIHKYYNESDLIPYENSILDTSDCLSDIHKIDAFMSIVDELHTKISININKDNVSEYVLAQIDFYRTLGCFDVLISEKNIIISNYTKFSINFIKSFTEQTKNGSKLIDDWRSKNFYEDRISGAQFLFFSELNRIDKSVVS